MTAYLLIVGSFFIPLEQGLKLPSMGVKCIKECSFFIPLEQGLKHLVEHIEFALALVLSSFH